MNKKKVKIYARHSNIQNEKKHQENEKKASSNNQQTMEKKCTHCPNKRDNNMLTGVHTTILRTYINLIYLNKQ